MNKKQTVCIKNVQRNVTLKHHVIQIERHQQDTPGSIKNWNPKS